MSNIQELLKLGLKMDCSNSSSFCTKEKLHESNAYKYGSKANKGNKY